MHHIVEEITCGSFEDIQFFSEITYRNAEGYLCIIGGITNSKVEVIQLSGRIASRLLLHRHSTRYFFIVFYVYSTDASLTSNSLHITRDKQITHGRDPYCSAHLEVTDFQLSWCG